MESFKKYLPWIIGAAILLYVLSRSRGGQTALAPQTQFIETPQSDPFATLRGEAFGRLVQLGIAETEAESEYQQGLLKRATTLDALRFESDIRSKTLDVDLAKSQLGADIATRLANLNFLQREQDREGQQKAVDRYYSSRQTGGILSSVNQALQTIFSGRGPSVGARTPPIFGGF